MKAPSFVCITFLTALAALSGCSHGPGATPVAASVEHLYQYQLSDADGKEITLAELLEQTRDADVIMVGEWHGHPGVHLFQAELFAALAAQEQPLALSMEHFTRADQPVLNQYLAGEIGESGLMNGAKVWDNYKSDYRPMVEIARHNNLAVIAANAPRNIVKCVGRKGPRYLNSLDKDQRQLAAQTIDISDSPYKQKFVNMMSENIPQQRVNQMFAAQLTWDATMAESIVIHKRANPKAKIFHVAGRFHVINGLGTGAEILKLEPQLKIRYISASSEQDPVNNRSDYRLHVQSLPPLAITKEERKAVFSKHKRSKVDCG